MRAHLLTSAVMLLLAPTVSTAQKPDFSGLRTLNRDESVLSPAMSGVQSGSLQIEHNDPRIRLTLTLVVGGTPFETVVELTTDGQEVTGTQQGRSYTGSAAWEGNALLIRSRSQGPTCETTISFRYELEDAGTRVRASETMRGCRDQDNVWVFDR